jgi:ubiquinone/menaquinone biosynthesis C-methylase UbiE
MDKTKMAVDVFDKRADVYAEKFMDTSMYHDTFDRFCSYLPHGAQVLELACGPGNITKHVLSIRPDVHILATDLSPNMIKIAARNNPAATFQIMDCRDTANTSRKYNGVLCGFGLPYLSKEEAVKLISDVSGILMPNGVFYLSTMEDDYKKSGIEKSSHGDEVYMHYHEEDYLVQAVSNNGMNLLQMQRLGYSGADGKQTTDLVIIAGK